VFACRAGANFALFAVARERIEVPVWREFLSVWERSPRCRRACREWDAVLGGGPGRNGASCRHDYRGLRDRRHGV